MTQLRCNKKNWDNDWRIALLHNFGSMAGKYFENAGNLPGSLYHSEKINGLRSSIECGRLIEWDEALFFTMFHSLERLLPSSKLTTCSLFWPTFNYILLGHCLEDILTNHTNGYVRLMQRIWMFILISCRRISQISLK